MIHRSFLLPVAVALAALGTAGCGTFWSVGSGEVAVVHTPQGVSPQPLQSGDYDLVPRHRGSDRDQAAARVAGFGRTDR
jgi:predicted small secreted protein